LIYGKRSNGGEHGSVITKYEVVDFMLDVCDYAGTNDLSQIKTLDPAAGEGAWLFCNSCGFQVR
jgi:hypothetical protein